MEKKPYCRFIQELVNKVPVNQPVYSEELAQEVAGYFQVELPKARTVVNVNLKRLADGDELQRYQRGVYYRAGRTVFGKTHLNPIKVSHDTYVKHAGLAIGYETGASFLNRLGLTTQIPKDTTIATNRCPYSRKRVINKYHLVLRKPPVPVTDENCKYLQLLDAIENRDQVDIDADQPQIIFLDYIKRQNLDFLRLVGLAGVHYSKRVQEEVVKIATADVR